MSNSNNRFMKNLSNITPFVPAVVNSRKYNSSEQLLSRNGTQIYGNEKNINIKATDNSNTSNPILHFYGNNTKDNKVGISFDTFENTNRKNGKNPASAIYAVSNNNGSNDLQFLTSQPSINDNEANVRMIIKANGKVGIGTTNPTKKLTVQGSAYISDDLTVGGDLIVSGNQIIGGDFDISGNLLVDDNITGFKDLFISGNTNLIGDTTISGNLDVNGDLIVSGNQIIGGDFDISGNLLVDDNITGFKDLFISGQTNLSGDTTISGNLDVNGDLIVSGNQTIGGDFDISGNLLVYDNITGFKDLFISGQTNLSGDTTITGDLNITGNTTITGEVMISGNTTLIGELIGSTIHVDNNGVTITGTLNVTGDTNITGKVNISGNSDLSGDVNITGTTIINDDSTNGGLSIINFGTGDADARFRLKANDTGEASIFFYNNGNNKWKLDSIGDANKLGDLELKNVAQSKSAIYITGSSNTINLMDNTNISGNLVSQNITSTSDLNVIGNTNIIGNLSVTGSTILKGSTTIDNTLTVNQPTTVSGSISLINAIAGYPTQDNQLIRKQDLAAIAAGLNVKASCVVATTSTTFSDINITSSANNIAFNSAVISVDGVTLSNGDRILVNNAQDANSGTGASNIYNGIYVYDTSTSWNRASDMLNGDSIQGSFTFIESGTTNGSKGFVQISGGTAQTVGTAPLTFTTFSSLTLTAGDGIVINGSAPSTLSVSGILQNVYNLGTNNNVPLYIGNDNESTNISGSSVNISGNTTITGSLTTYDTIIGKKDLFISGITTLSGDTFISGDLIVSGSTTLSGDVNISGNTNLSGNININSNDFPNSTSESTILMNYDNKGFINILGNTEIQAQSGNSAGDGTWIDGGHFDIGFNNFTTSGIVNIQGIGDKSSLFISNPLNGDGSYNVSGLPHILLNMSNRLSNEPYPGTANDPGYLGTFPFLQMATGNEDGGDPFIQMSMEIINYNQGGSGQYDDLGRNDTGLKFRTYDHDNGLRDSITINNHGNIGIKTDTPSQPLSVSGNTIITGNLEISGTITLNGNVNISGSISGFGITPIGGIIMWSGTLDGSSPTGYTNWKLCDGSIYGSITTPNLKSRFIVGYDPNVAAYNMIGNTGGTESVTLGIDEIPAHTHSFKYGNNERGGTATNSSNLEHTGDSKTTSSNGGGGSHENRPPYYTMAYIMRIN
jgi:predicted acyltransferase (DUF342 family)